MRNTLFVLILSCVLSVTVAHSESLYELYTFSEDNTIITESELVIALHLDPPTALEQLSVSDTTYDIYVFPLPCLGLTELLDSKSPASLSSSLRLSEVQKSMPAFLSDMLSRDNQLLAVPINLDMFSLQLVTTTEKLNSFGISHETIPTTLLSLLEAANEWYNSGLLDNVHLFHSYEAPEMIVYFALQQYVQTSSAHGATPDYADPFFKRLLEATLVLSDTMSKHNAFSEPSEYLFDIVRPDSSDAESTAKLVIPISLSDYHPSGHYVVGVVAIVNPHSLRREQAITFLSSQTEQLSSTTQGLLNSHSVPRTLSVSSEYVAQLASKNILFEVALQLANGDISIEQCINILQSPK